MIIVKNGGAAFGSTKCFSKHYYNGLLKMLDILLSRDTGPDEKKKTLKEEFDIPMTIELEGGILDMCNLSKGVYDSAVVDAIKNIMESTGWDIEKCMDYA